MPERLVVDTSVFVSALLSSGGPSRTVLRHCLSGQCVPLMGNTLFAEYEDVLSREEKFLRCALNASERQELLDALLSVCEWTSIFFLWRPNLPDEADNHLVELAIAGSAQSLVTNNTGDFRRGELRFPQLRIETPMEYLKRRRI
jgi:uncharacterized protein